MTVASLIVVFIGLLVGGFCRLPCSDSFRFFRTWITGCNSNTPQLGWTLGIIRELKFGLVHSLTNSRPVRNLR
jgi:hypothetical protein